MKRSNLRVYIIMKNKRFLFAALPVLLSLWIVSCSGAFVNDQIHFGVKAAQIGLWEEAIFRWEKAIENNPDSAAAYNNLAVAYEAKGNLEKAKQSYEKALEIQPGNDLIKDNYEKFMKIWKSHQGNNDEKK